MACLNPAAVSAEELRIFGADSNPPKHSTEDGLPRGYAFDIAAEAARRAGFVPRTEAMPWARALQNSKDGLGVIVAFSHVPERELDYLYTRPAFTDTVLLVHRAGDSRFQGRPVAADWGIVGVGRAGRYCKTLNDALSRTVVVETTDGPQRLNLLLRDRIDLAVFVGGRQGVDMAIRDAGISPSLIATVSPPACIDPNHIGVGRRMPGALEVRRRLDAALGAMQEDGTILKLLEPYISLN